MSTPTTARRDPPAHYRVHHGLALAATSTMGWPPDQAKELRDWIAELGFNPTDVGVLIIAGGLIHVVLYEADDQGDRYLACRGHDNEHHHAYPSTEHVCHVATRVETRDIPAQLPAWWRP